MSPVKIIQAAAVYSLSIGTLKAASCLKELKSNEKSSR